jgi:hypothetical protein
MLSLEVQVNGTLVTTAGVADAEKIDALVTICPGILESWVRVSGEIIPDHNPPADASWFHRGLSQGDTVTIRLVESATPSVPNLTRCDPSVESTDAIPFACSFCGKPNTEIERMWAGPKAQICNECIQFMHEMAVDGGVGSNNSLERTREG